jgi:hypothetical protein
LAVSTAFFQINKNLSLLLLWIVDKLETWDAFHQNGQTEKNGQIVEWNTKHLGFGPI